jgi:hypothetical protein
LFQRPTPTWRFIVSRVAPYKGAKGWKSLKIRERFGINLNGVYTPLLLGCRVFATTK